ncbi:MAG: amino acid adenylation domain-containing protein [Desulfobacterales bacterium]|nr:amino acid adenylation domain-containing protein [Desulfobacterales bacterium]
MKLSDFDILDGEKEREALHALLREFNQTETAYPRDQTVHRIFSERARETPDAPAVILGEKRLTYGQLERRSNRLARFLIRRGLPSEAFVGVMLDASMEMVEALLGVMKAGGAYFPIHPRLPHQRIQYMLRDSRAPVLISEKRRVRDLNKLQWECPDLVDILCLDSMDVHAETEVRGEKMKQEIWDHVGARMFDDISGGGWQSSYTGEWLSREVMDEYGENIRRKLAPLLTRESRVLEIGCASGISMFRLAPLAGAYLGTDLSPRILQWTEERRKKLGMDNIRLRCMAAHEIDRLDERPFDVVIINSVLQCFSGHNYLRRVIAESIRQMGDRGVLFLGNVWDQNLKESFIDSLEAYQKKHAGRGIRTKTDWYEELFIAPGFLDDLRHDLPEIVRIECSRMLGSAESELSRYGYDALLRIDKNNPRKPDGKRNKHQFDRRGPAACSDAPVEERSGPRGLIYLMYTSGTSGRPKGVMIEHRSVARLVRNTNFVRLGPRDRMLQTGALSFDASTFEIWGALLNGGVLVLAPDRAVLDAREMKRLIRARGVTIMWLTSSLFNQLADADLDLFTGLKTLLTGGEKLSPHRVHMVKRAHPDLTLINGYGPTENTTFTTCHRIEETGQSDIPIGKPIANTRVLILDKRDGQTPIGAAGEICTCGDGLSRGYLNDPGLTREKFVPHPFEEGRLMYRTGDLGRWTPGGVVEYLGRMDNQVKIRGYRIEPAEIENRLLECEGVKEAVVLAGDYGSGGVELAAYVTGGEDLRVEEARARLKDKLPDYMVPAHFTRLDRIPLNQNGKVDKRALPIPDSARDPGEAPGAPLETETEKRLAEIWERILERKGVGAEDDFFDIGGHSLKVTRMVALIQEEMGLEVSIGTIFKASTIRELARRLMDDAKFGVDLADKVMVRLNDGDGDGKIFAFPPGTGDVLDYIQLAGLLDGHALYAFNFIEGENRMKDYADIITALDPRGPYTFLGYSGGGNIAYHVAGELLNRGGRVSDIIMLDSARRLEKVPNREEDVTAVAEEFLSQESLRPYLSNTVLKEKALRRIKSSFAFFDAMVDHHVVNSDIHVVLAEDSPDVHEDASGAVLASVSAWADATRGKLQIIPGSGGHNRMLRPPHLERNADLLKKILWGARD